MSSKNKNEEFESLEQYLKKIKEIPLLSKEEEISFCRNIENGYRGLLITIMEYTLERSQYEGLALIQNKVKEYKAEEINSSYSQLENQLKHSLKNKNPARHKLRGMRPKKKSKVTASSGVLDQSQTNQKQDKTDDISEKLANLCEGIISEEELRQEARSFLSKIKERDLDFTDYLNNLILTGTKRDLITTLSQYRFHKKTYAGLNLVGGKISQKFGKESKEHNKFCKSTMRLKSAIRYAKGKEKKSSALREITEDLANYLMTEKEDELPIFGLSDVDDISNYLLLHNILESPEGYKAIKDKVRERHGEDSKTYLNLLGIYGEESSQDIPNKIILEAIALYCNSQDNKTRKVLDSSNILSLAKKIRQDIPDQNNYLKLEQKLKVIQTSKNELTKHNLRLVVNFAKKYSRTGMSLVDMINEGNLGLMRAVEKFQYRQGYRFSTYAIWWIRHSIQRSISERLQTIRKPTHIIENIKTIRRIQNELEYELDGKVTSEDLARKLLEKNGVKINDTNLLKKEMETEKILQLIHPTTSLNYQIGEDESTSLDDIIEDPNAALGYHLLDAKNIRKKILEVLETSGLTKREIRILRMRFGIEPNTTIMLNRLGNPNNQTEHTLSEVGNVFNLTRERIRQLETEALNKLRKLAKNKQMEELKIIYNSEIAFFE